MKANHKSELESLKALHQSEKEQVQAAINETEIKKLRQEAEVNVAFILAAEGDKEGLTVYT